MLWFEKQRNPVLSNITEIYNVWPLNWRYAAQPGIYGPQIVTCAIPQEYATQVPQAITVQDIGDCSQMQKSPSNVVKVINNTPEPGFHKPSIGICVQAFRFATRDVSVRLVEWLEMVKLMGGDKVYFYVFGAIESMRKVLRHYERQVYTYKWTAMLSSD